jgi:hypothetical protein
MKGERGLSERRGKSPEESLVRGSVLKMRRKCGKGNCRCVEGALHETWVLSYSLDGHTRMVTLRPKDVPEVRRAVRRYRKAEAELEARALRGIDALREKLQGPGKKRRKRED